MHGLSVLKQNYAQVLPACLGNPRPPANPAIRLDRLGIRLHDDAFDPLVPNALTVRSLPDVREVLRELHLLSIANPFASSSATRP